MLHVVSELFETHVLVGVELDPDCADLGFGVGVPGGCREGVFLEHFGGGDGGEVDLCAAAERSVKAAQHVEEASTQALRLHACI